MSLINKAALGVVFWSLSHTGLCLFVVLVLVVQWWYWSCSSPMGGPLCIEMEWVMHDKGPVCFGNWFWLLLRPRWSVQSAVWVRSWSAVVGSSLPGSILQSKWSASISIDQVTIDLRPLLSVILVHKPDGLVSCFLHLLLPFCAGRPSVVVPETKSVTVFLLYNSGCSWASVVKRLCSLFCWFLMILSNIVSLS